MPSIAVFDVGNILLKWDPRNLYQRVFSDPARMAFFLDHVCTAEWNLAQDRGRSWAEAEAEAIARHPDFAPEIRAFRARWAETVGGPIKPNVALLDTLRSNGVRNYAITNFAEDTFAEAQEMYPFLKGFDGIICSGVEKVCKPDAAIYQILLDRYHLKAEDCVFIDDSMANITAAAKLGFHTIHYMIGLDARSAFAQFGFPVD